MTSSSWSGTPLKHPQSQFIFLGFCSFFKKFQLLGVFCFLVFGFESKGISLIFCVFWKRFWKCGGTLELLLILTIRSALNAPMFQRPASKSRYVFCFYFFMTYILFGFFDTLLDFLDIFAYAHTHTHIYIYTWHELRKVEISKW